MSSKKPILTGSNGAPTGPSAFERHQLLIADYVKYYGHKPQRDASRDRTDADVLREAHRFLRSDSDNDDSTYEKRLARRYYDMLFKEFCLADLSKFRKSRIGLRWRTEAEVFAGKGQFVCANVECNSVNSLKSYEVEFRYVEAGEDKVALVKVRVCNECAFKLNYKHFKRIAAERRSNKLVEQTKRKREHEKTEENDELAAPTVDDDVERRADALLAEVAQRVAEEAAQSRIKHTSASSSSSALKMPSEFVGLFD